jgi:hypothetical protein
MKPFTVLKIILSSKNLKFKLNFSATSNVFMVYIQVVVLGATNNFVVNKVFLFKSQRLLNICLNSKILKFKI